MLTLAGQDTRGTLRGPGGLTLTWDGVRDAEGRPDGVVLCAGRSASLLSLLASDDPHLFDGRDGSWHVITWDQWTWLLRTAGVSRATASAPVPDPARIGQMQAYAVTVMMKRRYASEALLFRALADEWALDHLRFAGQDEPLLRRVAAQAWQAQTRSDARHAAAAAAEAEG